MSSLPSTQTPLSSDSLKAGSQPKLRIAKVGLDFTREPFHTPIGFKGNQFTEKWVSTVNLTSVSGAEVTSHGGQAVLWSDPRVFLSHTEAGAYALMGTVTDFALQRARETDFVSPFELHDAIVDKVHAFACQLTGFPDLNQTFTLNAMVALDNAAWLLYARENGFSNFDALIPDDLRSLLSARHDKLAGIPMVSYNTPSEEILSTVNEGHFMLKIKLGSPGDPQSMLAADLERLRRINRQVGNHETPHTDDGRIRYYLDANGRYQTREQVEAILDFADQEGFLEQIILFEEPFAPHSTESVGGLPVIFAADESLHRVEDVALRWEAGYRAVTLKPAGKGLTTTFRLAREAERLGAIAFVADSSCTPALLDWNKNVAARLPALPGMKMSFLEVNGWQSYAHWDALMDKHPASKLRSLRLTNGHFILDEAFYTSGGLF